MRATKKNKQKNNITGKIFFIFRNELVFYRNVFLSPEIDWFFSENRQQSNARAGQKKTHVFFALPLLVVAKHCCGCELVCRCDFDVLNFFSETSVLRHSTLSDYCSPTCSQE